MKTRIHAIAGTIGFLTILLFWTSTVLSELFASHATVATVKSAILMGMFVLIPAMAIVGGSGFSLAAGRNEALVSAKKKRMPIIGANGLLVLVPMAFFLESKAAAGQFDATFYSLQAVELLAGATNLVLMGLNMRDGIRLSGKAAPTTQVTLTSSETIATGTMAFHMTKPAGFQHQAGQWIRLTIADAAEDGKASSRILSIVSAPDEPQITVATRLSDSAFKRSLSTLTDGAELTIAGPSGTFTLHEDASRPAVFIAGGIGITPFMSMLRNVTATKAPHKIALFYSNRAPAGAPFLSELEELQKANSNFQLIATMTDLDAQDSWVGETSKIDQDMLQRHLKDLDAPIYYCVGPAGMVTATQKMLRAAGVAEQDIRVESFTGY
ncbi:FAD-dependent oxidoreductase [Phaeobacter gallaeciensis]|uniref:Oxidoreductase n=1 Tax=Phaeobacter gallaeciensis TaxID=60890 RepID=A0AAC9Z720_9RHOB|nr:FAD-dependent oxidoreductase [Phaeobacter gallaeciensis]AHD08614.1 Flavodoxin reductase (ferredoxin-NADPH reductase) family 1 [Phaeobacter gallaeciensis DSM 26640]ATE91880.1 putative oxidoreductase [Phaeobacter gallaeciensis]ATE98296.1 putative oxidoreductase [Phaeobacter gallaeciensis]ATF00496.1 putative oxidoreductase [Phaeobacter gallaeciensis]ATF04927.1 putative oxidoreductase [Phaeobacter gallaeciensis]